MATNLPGRHFVANLIRGRSLIFQLVRRDFEQRYIGSMMGWIWGLIHPLVLLGVYTFVFHYALGIKLPPDEVTDNYPLFLFAGMLPWLLFSETLQRSASSLPEHANLIKKSVFPVEIVPVTIFLSTLLSHLLALVLLFVAVLIWADGLTSMVAVVPLYLALAGLLSIGLGWILAAINVYLRDAGQVLSVALTAWFWLTPIFLYEELLNQKLPGVVQWNPATYLVRGYRQTILGGALPEAGDVLILTAFAVSAFVLGGLFFRQTKRGFADVL